MRRTRWPITCSGWHARSSRRAAAANIGFDQPVPVSDDVSLLDRLIAFTGRQPVN
jgi:hypothetical protein